MGTNKKVEQIPAPGLPKNRPRLRPTDDIQRQIAHARRLDERSMIEAARTGELKEEVLIYFLRQYGLKGVREGAVNELHAALNRSIDLFVRDGYGKCYNSTVCADLADEVKSLFYWRNFASPKKERQWAEIKFRLVVSRLCNEALRRVPLALLSYDSDAKVSLEVLSTVAETPSPEDRIFVDELLQPLNTIEREVFVLRYGVDCGLEDIAASIGRNERTVRRLLDAAETKVRFQIRCHKAKLRNNDLRK